MRYHRITAFCWLPIIGLACAMVPVCAQPVAVSYEDDSSATPRVKVAGNALTYTWLTGKSASFKSGFLSARQDYQGHVFRTRLTGKQTGWIRQWIERNRLFALQPYYSRANTHRLVAGDTQQRLLLADGGRWVGVSWWGGSKNVPQRLTAAVSQLVTWAEAVRDENVKTTGR